MKCCKLSILMTCILFFVSGCAWWDTGGIAPIGEIPIEPIGSNNRAVWVEINTGSEAELQILAEGIPLWEPIVDYYIVTTTPGDSKVAMYADIVTNKPLVAGLKPSYLFGCTRVEGRHHVYCNMNQPDAWIQYAEWIRKLVDATEDRTLYQKKLPVFVLENESLVYSHTVGDYEIDPDIIRAGLEHFPKNVMYYWYPAVSSGYPERRARQEELLRIVMEVLPNVRLVDTTHGRHKTVFEDFHADGLHRNKVLSTMPLVNMIHVYPSQDYWKDSQVAGIMGDLFEKSELILYPGQAGFVEQGRIFRDLLPYQTPRRNNGLIFDPSGERIMQIYLNPFDRRGYDALSLIPHLNNEFTTIALHGWCWHRYPDQFEDPVVQQAIADIKAKGFKLIIGRAMWPRWLTKEEQYSWAASRALPFDERWVREELEAIMAEQKKYGAWATYVDAEPYGQRRITDDGSSVVFEGSRHALKAHEGIHGWELAMTIHERRIFANTLRRVQKTTGLSWDFVYPSSSGRADGYQWALNEIGKYGCNSKCFYLTDITDKIPMASDSGYGSHVDIWYSAATNPAMPWNTNTTLGPDDVRDLWLQFEEGKFLYPELNGFMVFSGPENQKDFLEAFVIPSGLD